MEAELEPRLNERPTSVRLQRHLSLWTQLRIPRGYHQQHQRQRHTMRLNIIKSEIGKTERTDERVELREVRDSPPIESHQPPFHLPNR